MATSRWQLNNTTGGLWGSAGNWTAGVPNAAGDTATFAITDAALSGGGAGTRTIDLGGTSKTVGFLHLVGDVSRTWDISNGTLVLQSLGGNAFVDYASTGASGDSRISATIQLASSADFYVDRLDQFLRVGALTESGGSRSIQKLGAGQMVITGSNTTTGTTTITAGKLQIGDQGTTGSLGSGAVVNNATLVFARADNITVGNQITGSGDIAIAGQNASVTLTGANTINNFVVVQNNATLKLGNVHALDGNGSVFVDAGSTFDFNGITPTGADLFNGTFFNRISPTAPGAITNSDGVNQVFLFDANNTNDSFAGSLQGNIDFLHSGTGTLTLTGSSTLSGFQILAGTVKLSGANAQINASADIKGGTFDISGSGLSTVTVRDLSGNATGHVVLGGKTLQVSDAIFFGDPGNSANAPGVTGTTGLTDTLRVNMEAGRTTALDASTVALTNWTDGVDKVVLTGNALNNTITGTAFGDEINGGLGNDTIHAGGGNDTMLDGRDLLGNDIYDGGAGFDSVRYDLATKAVVVNLSLTTAQSTGGGGKDTLIGIENVTGSAFNDTLTGNSGDNNLFGFNGNDKLVGGAGNDHLFGGLGIDTLDGGIGIDVLAGEGGNDTYIVDNTADTVVELLGDGTDLVNASVSFTLAANVENLTLTGTGVIVGTGNELNNVMKANNAGSTLFGLAGNDTLTGGAGNDTLDGGIGQDKLEGGLGADIMSGGADNDSYMVDNAGDQVIELAGGGTDTVTSKVTFTLGANVENLTLTGTGDIDGIGNSLNNVIKANNIGSTLFGLGGNDTLTGGTVGDTLIGGAGKDTLTGGTGDDDFVFDIRETAANADIIKDFSHAQGDLIIFKTGAFTELAPFVGQYLGAAQIAFGTAATTPEQRVIYNSATGGLFYDADGSGSGAQVLVATLSNHATLSVGDFFVL